MRFQVPCLVLLGLLVAGGTGKDCPHRKAATLLPSFTMTPTTTESTASPTTTSHRPTTTSHKPTTTSHRPTTTSHRPPTTTSHRPTTTSHRPTTTSHKPTTTSHRPTTTSHKPTTTSHKPTTTSHRPTTTSHGNVTVHPTSNSTTTSSRPATSTHSPAMTTSHGNATVYPTTDNSTAPTPGSITGPPPGPPPPSPSPRPGSEGALGNYTWMNGSQPCVRLQAQIQIRILYPTQGGGKAWGISTLNPNKTKVQGGCDSADSHLSLSFPYGQLTLGFKQDLEQSQSIYLNYMAVEYNVSFPQAARFSCASDQSLLLPLIIGLVLLGLLALVLVAFCVTRRRQSAYQPL